jgi:serine/threonine protein kinase
MSDRTILSFAFDNRVAALSTITQSCDDADKHQAMEGRDSFSLTGFNELSSVDDLVISLDMSGIHGPLVLWSDCREDYLLGRGAQFEVYETAVMDSSETLVGAVYEPVAVKRALFKLADGHRRLNLSSRKSRRQIHDMYLEVVALRHEALRRHRNVVRLLGWSSEYGIHSMPLLVTELALGDLCTLFEDFEDEMTSEVIQQLSIDIGRGLDAIHEADIIHGDIKAPNILVFENLGRNYCDAVPFVAKLADFGLSISEVKASMDDAVYVSGMSADWCAPEIIPGAKLSTSELIKADNFSYGLVLASMSCYQGQAPTTKNPEAILDVMWTCTEMSDTFRLLSRAAISGLLQWEGSQRPVSVGGLLIDGSVSCKDW